MGEGVGVHRPTRLRYGGLLPRIRVEDLGSGRGSGKGMLTEYLKDDGSTVFEPQR